jgi:hypothetical protein
LLARHETLRKPQTPPQPPQMWVHLYGVQICWIYFTLAKLQWFFTEAAEDKIIDATTQQQIKQFLSKYSFQTVQPVGINSLPLPSIKRLSLLIYCYRYLFIHITS